MENQTETEVRIMFCEDKQDWERRAVTRAALHCAVLGRKYTSRRARFYLRIAEDDPPEHPARPPCAICTLKNWWSTAPPQTTSAPVKTGEPRAGPKAVRRCYARGGDG